MCLLRRIKQKTLLSASKRNYGKKAAITGFSRRSRMTLLRAVNSIDRRQVDLNAVVFVTLTFPAAYPSPLASKSQLEQFRRCFLKAYPGAWGYWRLEPQKRGAPHYHLLLNLGRPAFDPDVLWVARTWHGIAGGGDPKHLAFALGKLPGSRPCVEPLKSWEGAAYYAAKYLAKPGADVPGWDFPGRFWGTLRRKLIPRDVEKVELTASQAVDFHRLQARYARSRPSPRIRVVELPATGTRKITRMDAKHLPAVEQLAAQGGCTWSYIRRKMRGRTYFVPELVTDRLLAFVQALPPRRVHPGFPPGHHARERLAEWSHRYARQAVERTSPLPPAEWHARADRSALDVICSLPPPPPQPFAPGWLKEPADRGQMEPLKLPAMRRKRRARALWHARLLPATFPEFSAVESLAGH